MAVDGLGLDVDDAPLVRKLRAAVGDDHRVVAMFDADEYRLLHVADRVLDEHGGESAFRDATDQLHSYVTLDFLETRLFDDLFPGLGGVEALSITLELGVVTRYYVDGRGILVATDGGVASATVIGALDAALAG